jgi:hypothetical protein
LVLSSPAKADERDFRHAPRIKHYRRQKRRHVGHLRAECGEPEMKFAAEASSWLQAANSQNFSSLGLHSPDEAPISSALVTIVV